MYAHMQIQDDATTWYSKSCIVIKCFMSFLDMHMFKYIPTQNIYICAHRFRMTQRRGVN